MKTTDNKLNHVGLRMDDDTLILLDGLCEACGGASRSRVLRSLLLWLQPMPSDCYQSYDGKPVEENRHRREFVEHVRRCDDAVIQGMLDAITATVRRK